MWKFGRLSRSDAATVLDCEGTRYIVMLAGRLTDAQLEPLIDKKVAMQVIQDGPNSDSIWVNAVEPR